MIKSTFKKSVARLMIVTILVSTVILAVPVSSSAEDLPGFGVYCKITGATQGLIEGSQGAPSTSSPIYNTIRIKSINLGFSGSGSKRVEITNFNPDSSDSDNTDYLVKDLGTEDSSTAASTNICTITKDADRASNKLMKAFNSGETLTDVTFIIQRQTSAGGTYNNIKLTNAKIVARNTEFVYSKGEIETISFSYQKATETDTINNSDPSLTGIIGVAVKLKWTGSSASDEQNAIFESLNGYKILQSSSSSSQSKRSVITTTKSIKLVKLVDKYSQKIGDLFTKKTSISEATLFINMPNTRASTGTGAAMSVKTIKLSNPVVTSRRIFYDFSNHDPRAPNQTAWVYEEIVLSFSSITETYSSNYDSTDSSY